MFKMSTIGRDARVQTFAKVVNSFVDRRHAASHPRSAAVRLLAPEWFWALSELCEMPEALHPTHDSQVPGRWVEVW